MNPQKFPCAFPSTPWQSHLIAFTCFVLHIPVVFSCHFVFILFFFCIVHCTVVISFSLPRSVWCWKKISNKLVSTSIHHTSTKMEETTSSWLQLMFWMCSERVETRTKVYRIRKKCLPVGSLPYGWLNYNRFFCRRVHPNFR